MIGYDFKKNTKYEMFIGSSPEYNVLYLVASS